MAGYWLVGHRSPIWAYIYTRVEKLLVTPDPRTSWAEWDWTTQPLLKLVQAQEDRNWLVQALRVSAKIGQEVSQETDMVYRLPLAQRSDLYRKQILEALKPLLIDKMMGEGELVWMVPDPPSFLSLNPGTG